MGKKQVFSAGFGVWIDVEVEDEDHIQCKDVDGMMLYVIKDGTEKVRFVEKKEVWL